MEIATQQELAVVTASDNQLSTTLLSLESTFETAARRNVLSYVGEVNDYTETEIQSMVTIEQLKLINGMDLAAVLMRGKLLSEIENRGLWATHPGQYTNLQEMAQDQGISMSELSNVRTLCDVIFPYMTETLDMNIAEVWERIGKSNFRDLAAVLRCLITSDTNARASVTQSAERILDEVHATFRSSHPDEELEDAEARAIAVRGLLEGSEGLTNREVRQRIRPDRTASIPMTFVNHGDRKFILAEITGDQETLLQNRLHGYMDPLVVTISTDPQMRVIQAARVREIREIFNLFTRS